MKISNHAFTRIQQRGMRPPDIDLIFYFGTETSEGYLLNRKDVQTAVADLKKLISRLERLSGAAIYTAEDIVKTSFRPTKKQRRRLLPH